MPMRYRVSVVLDASVEEMESRIRPGEGELEPSGEGQCRFRTQSDSLEWLTMRLLWLGVDFEVEEPEELVEHVAALAGRLGRAATVGPDVWNPGFPTAHSAVHSPENGGGAGPCGTQGSRRRIAPSTAPRTASPPSLPMPRHGSGGAVPSEWRRP